MAERDAKKFKQSFAFFASFALSALKNIDGELDDGLADGKNKNNVNHVSQALLQPAHPHQPGAN